MTHFCEGDWADFVRGMPIEGEALMKTHLAACSECHDLVFALRAVEEVHRRDIVQEPPSHAVHAAREIFATRTPESRRPLLLAAARLMFDSFASPAFAGIRSGQPAYRQLLYEAQPYVIDLRLDQHRGDRLVSLTGQVSSVDATRSVAGVRVTLTDDGGSRVVEQMCTNAAGEFHCEYEPAPWLQLQLEVDSFPRIELPALRTSDAGQDFRRK